MPRRDATAPAGSCAEGTDSANAGGAVGTGFGIHRHSKEGCAPGVPRARGEVKARSLHPTLDLFTPSRRLAPAVRLEDGWLRPLTDRPMVNSERSLRYEDAPRGDDLAGDLGVTTLIVDDQLAFREAMADLIDAMPGFVLVGRACTGEEAVAAVEQVSPQLVLMDVAMPGMGGIAAARVILGKYPRIVIVLISIDHPALYPEARDLCRGEVVCARKQDLRPSELRRVWELHHN
jgi:Response regulator receiver domain